MLGLPTADEPAVRAKGWPRDGGRRWVPALNRLALQIERSLARRRDLVTYPASPYLDALRGRYLAVAEPLE